MNKNILGMIYEIEQDIEEAKKSGYNTEDLEGLKAYYIGKLEELGEEYNEAEAEAEANRQEIEANYYACEMWA